MTDTPPAFDLATYAKDVTESAKYLKMLIYGDPKVGKTTFAGTAPSPLFLAVEPGTVVLVKNEENRARFKDTKVMEVKNMTMFNRVMGALRAGQMPDRKTIVLDTLSEFQHRVLMQWTKHAMDTGLSKNDNFLTPEWPEYNATTNMLKKAMWEFRDLERHIIVIAHCRDDSDKTRGGMSVDRPALMPSLGAQVAAMFNLVGYMFVDHDGVTKMRVQASPTVVAGSHIWSGAPIVDNPEFDTFKIERAD